MMRTLTLLADGRLFWIWDAYTVSSYYPFSQPVQAGFNYIRNSVKVVIDAYNGDVTFYLSDPSDPVAATLSKIFKSLFKPLTICLMILRLISDILWTSLRFKLRCCVSTT